MPLTPQQRAAAKRRHRIQKQADEALDEALRDVFGSTDTNKRDAITARLLDRGFDVRPAR